MMIFLGIALAFAAAFVQSSRGLVSVVLGWFLARHGFADVEERFFCYFATLVEGSDLLLLTYCRPHLNDASVYRIPYAIDRP